MNGTGGWFMKVPATSGFVCIVIGKVCDLVAMDLSNSFGCLFLILGRCYW